MCFSTGGSANKIAKQQRADEVARQQRINSGMSKIDGAFAGFNDDFYNARKRAYLDYALPGVERQAADARRGLIFALSRNGNLDSSAAIFKDRELTREADQARLDVGNVALDQANRTRADVENVRSGLVAQLNATGNDQAAAAAALRQAQNLNMPQGFSPLGQLFANFAAGLSRIGSNEGNGYGGFFGGASSGYPMSSTGSQRVVGGGR